MTKEERAELCAGVFVSLVWNATKLHAARLRQPRTLCGRRVYEVQAHPFDASDDLNCRRCAVLSKREAAVVSRNSGPSKKG